MSARTYAISLTATVALILAGCGGSTRTVTQTVTQTTAAKALIAPAHPCTANDTTLGCVLATQPPPPRAFSLNPGQQYGVDFGWGSVSASGAKAIGARFGASYLSLDSSKDWTRSAVDRYHALGLATVNVYETYANRAQAGFNAGFTDAYNARSKARALGEPDSRPIDYAVDCDCAVSTLTSYFSGVDAGTASILHIPHAQAVALVGAYGGYYQVRGLYNAGLLGHTSWQTYAWSGNGFGGTLWLPATIAPLEQYLNGNAFDNDRAIAADYGQWPFNAGPPSDPYAIMDHTKRHFVVKAYSPVFGAPRTVVASEYGTMTTAHRFKCHLGRTHPALPACRSSKTHLALLENRLLYVVHRYHGGSFNYDHARPRNRIMTKALARR